MKSKNYLGASILFFVFALVFSLLFWEDVSMAAKIGLFVLGFGSGVAAGQWFARRSI
jgi:dolichol kinase